jgi:GMP synthase-like glutamine amidotransferase
MILIIKHIFIEGPGTLGEFFADTSWRVNTIELENGDALPPLDECTAVISLGGPMNVYETDKHPFLMTEEIFLRRALEKKLPVLGICLGAQLLAKSVGAPIYKAEQKEIGWQSVNLTEEGMRDNLFKGMDDVLDVFQWHEDTFDNPKQGRLLATSNICRNQAFRIGNCAWGLQFHLELTERMLENWLDYYKVDLDKDKLLQDYFIRKDKYNKQARLLYLNFASLIN